MTIRSKLIALTGTLVALLVIATAHSAVSAWLELRANRQVAKVNSLSGLLLESAASWAQERSLTIFGISDPQQATAAWRATILDQRRRADMAFHEALSYLEAGPAFVERQQDIQKARARYKEVVILRSQIDPILATGLPAADPGLVEAWFAAISGLITDSQMLRLAQAVRIPAPYIAARIMNGFVVRHALWEISEFISRERGMLSAVIATGQPLTAEQLRTLAGYDGRIASAWAGVAARKSDLSTEFNEQLATIRKAYFGTFGALRESIYAAGLRGMPYPVTPQAWSDQASVLITKIITAQERATSEVNQWVEEEVSMFERQLFIAIIMAGGALLIGGIVCLVLTHHVIQPIQSVTRLIQQLGEGDFQVDESEQSRQDEIGSMIRSLQQVNENTEALRAREERVRHAALHDPLTGLPNRHLFHDRLHHALAAAHRHQERVALLYLDLDHFKDINDTFGHAAGDKLLKTVARRLQECVRESDTVARLGGDEFAIVQPGLQGPDNATLIASKIIDRLGQPINIGGQEICTATSIGITFFPTDHQDPEQLLKNADLALYAAKRKGRGQFQFFSAEMNAEVLAHTELSYELAQALSRNQLQLVYQPQVDLVSNQIVGVEALLRWQHPRRGLIMPESFITIAESTGQIVPIGEWVLTTACEQVRYWQDASMPNLRLAVNVSGVQFKRSDFAQMAAAVLSDTGFNARHLDIEITESTFIYRSQVSFAETLTDLHQMGIYLTIDDFGSGYSSLSHLKRFSIAKLKIDRSFIHAITADPDYAAIVGALINLGHSLGVEVIAKGVTSKDQLTFLRENGCDEFQGFYYSRPLPPEHFPSLVERYATHA